jgi:hypothetical protein
MANIGVLCAASDTISIVFNFIALAIIAEFDNYVFDSMKSESFKEMTEKKFCKRIFIIHHTTSKKCKEGELSDVKDENGNYRPLRVTMSSRTTVNKILFCTYKVLRTFFVSLFFYFLPFSAIIISNLTPILYKNFYVDSV